MLRIQNTLAVALLAIASTSPALAGGKKSVAKPVESTVAETGVLWQDPQDITSRDLFFGPGGEQHQPGGQFTFLKEDRNGTNPKFTVVDSDGVKWKVKLGIEARPETVATRLVWAVGYTADEDYFVPLLRPADMPGHLHRGQQFVAADGSLPDVRLEREQKGDAKVGNWKWRHNPFIDTREWNGLRVLMAVINNWDLEDKNNSIREAEDAAGQKTQIYYISDLGASFGTTQLARPRSIAKGNLESYRASGFIKRVTPEYVDFENPRRPPLVFLVNPHEFFSRVRLDWIGHHIPRADARWMGELLGRLSPSQLQDAFRAAGYSPDDVEGFTLVLRNRIEELNKL